MAEAIVQDERSGRIGSDERTWDKIRFGIRWRDISIKSKVLIIGMIIIAIFSSIIFSYILPAVERNAITAQDEMVRNVVRSSIAIADALNIVAGSGELPLDKAKDIAQRRLRELRYGDELRDSLWIIDAKATMIALPYIPAFEGQDMKEYTDPDGVKVFRNAAEICDRSKNGYLNFRWQRYDNANSAEPMRAYVESYQPWGWVIGSGFYLSDAEYSVRQIRLRLTFIVIGAMIVSLVLLYLFARGIARRLELARSGVGRMSGGDFSSAIAVDGHDETGMMLHSYNDFVGTIKDVIGEVNDASLMLVSGARGLAAASGSLSDDSRDQAAAAEEISATIEEITSETENIAAEASAQSSRISEVRTRIDRLTDDLSRMNSQLDETCALTDSLKSVSREAEDSVAQMSESMKKINASSREMSAIVEMIGEISERINLLSLNAAIEAARAGDAGRGFAVVSDEISKLADQTAKSLSGIEALIRQNEREISSFSRNAGAMLDMTGSVTGGIGKISGMTDHFRETMNDGLETNRAVLEGFSELARRAEIIQSATHEQKTAMDETAKSVSDISFIAQKTAGSSDTIAENSREFSLLAERLKARVSFFKT
ncbi:MAG TPA: methyl-accepting chemotaxis protein [Spirochaetota bacterium]